MADDSKANAPSERSKEAIDAVIEMTRERLRQDAEMLRRTVADSKEYAPHPPCGIGIGAPPDVRICGAPTTGHGVTLRNAETGESQRIPLCDEHHAELERRQAGRE